MAPKARTRCRSSINAILRQVCSAVHNLAMEFTGTTGIPDAMGWLEGASPELRRDLHNRAHRMSVPTGHAFIRAEDPTGGITVILSGRVDLHLPRVREGRTLVHAFGPGWWLGDLSALSGEPRRFDHVAAVPSELLRLGRSEVSQIGEDHPALWRFLARMVTVNMALVIDAVEQHRIADPTVRVAMCLFRLHRTGTAWGGRLPVSQGDLASIADLSRRRTIAALEHLECAGVLRRSYGAVEMIDLDALQAWRCR